MTKTPKPIRVACETINGFETLYYKLERTIFIEGKSISTLHSYGSLLARLAIHFNRLPTELEREEIDEYLYLFKQTNKSETYFKFMIYSLRMLYRIEGMEHRSVQLPKFKRIIKLPVVLNKDEVRRLLVAPRLQKHKLLLSLLYGCGLRCAEVRSLKLQDLDFDRRLVHIKQGKGRKDRYVPLNIQLVSELQHYIRKYKPKEFLFNGKPLARVESSKEMRYSQRGAQWVVTQAALKAGIVKPVSSHTLRHTYATHLLEDGLDIVTIKDLLGHSKIETTMVYLHVVRLEQPRAFSPLDTLYVQRQALENAPASYPFVCPAIKILQQQSACGKPTFRQSNPADR